MREERWGKKRGWGEEVCRALKSWEEMEGCLLIEVTRTCAHIQFHLNAFHSTTTTLKPLGRHHTRNPPFIL